MGELCKSRNVWGWGSHGHKKICLGGPSGVGAEISTCHLENIAVLLSKCLSTCSSGKPMIEKLRYQPGFSGPLQGSVGPQQMPHTIMASIYQLLQVHAILRRQFQQEIRDYAIKQ